ncbi:MAG: hypothetical protein ABI321_05625 [Polyangia bacterium]
MRFGTHPASIFGMRKTGSVCSLLAASVSLFAITLSGGCNLGCQHLYTKSTTLQSDSFTPEAGSEAMTSVLIQHLVSLDGKGRADESIATVGDFLVSTTGDPEGWVFLSGHAVADALVGTHLDLRKAPGGTVLVGTHFDLECSRQLDGDCLENGLWVGAAASGSIDVVAATSAPAPLLTLDFSATVTPSTGAVVVVKGTLTLDLTYTETMTGESGDCS